jgi:hypothetical protein
MFLLIFSSNSTSNRSKSRIFLVNLDLSLAEEEELVAKKLGKQAEELPLVES